MKKSLHLSYRQFARRRPFYVTEPKAKDRDTCACMDHENVHLLANKLYSRGLLKTKSISELLVMIVCDPKNKDCMDRVCAKCCFEEVEFPETESSSEVTWEQWKRVTSTNGERMFGNMVKQIYSGTIKDLMKLFSQKLESLAIHPKSSGPGCTRQSSSATLNKTSQGVKLFCMLTSQRIMHVN